MYTQARKLALHIAGSSCLQRSANALPGVSISDEAKIHLWSQGYAPEPEKQQVHRNKATSHNLRLTFWCCSSLCIPVYSDCGIAYQIPLTTRIEHLVLQLECNWLR